MNANAIYIPTAQQIKDDALAVAHFTQSALDKGHSEAEAEEIVNEIISGMYKTRATGDKSHYAAVYHKHIAQLIA